MMEFMEFVNGFRMTSLFYEMENNPFMFETTKQMINYMANISQLVLLFPIWWESHKIPWFQTTNLEINGPDIYNVNPGFS